MQLSEYLVTHLDGRWMVTCTASSHGPFNARRFAVHAALTMAKTDLSSMQPATVTVEDDGQLELIYDSTAN